MSKILIDAILKFVIEEEINNILTDERLPEATHHLNRSQVGSEVDRNIRQEILHSDDMARRVQDSENNVKDDRKICPLDPY